MTAVRARRVARQPRALIPVAAIALLIAACGGDGGDAKTAVTPVEGSGRATVVAEEGSFNVERIEVAAGATTAILFENRDEITHTFTVYLDDTPEGDLAADSGEVASGDSGGAVVFFSTPGEHAFRCEIHPEQMNGAVIVR